MATPKKSVTKASKGTKRARRNPKRTWNVYVSRSLRSINSQMSMTSRTMKIVNSFVSDLFERIATEAATLWREQEAHAGRTRTTDSGGAGAAGRPRQARNGGGHQGGVTRVQLDACTLHEIL
ncbi:putative Core histone H2A H2B H3 H4 [Trypanosoma vivax]|nr:putative Core histone H2A H2B H3 H4 [Trypanosoma vivax]